MWNITSRPKIDVVVVYMIVFESLVLLHHDRTMRSRGQSSVCVHYSSQVSSFREELPMLLI